MFCVVLRIVKHIFSKKVFTNVKKCNIMMSVGIFKGFDREESVISSVSENCASAESAYGVGGLCPRESADKISARFPR